MSARLKELHHTMSRRGQGYDRKCAAVRAYKAYAASIAQRLPFRWHPVGASNPRNNHQGGAYGSDHIVLDEPVTFGRLIRQPHDALCKPGSHFHGNLWVDSDGPTCKRCLEIAERIISP